MPDSHFHESQFRSQIVNYEIIHDGIVFKANHNEIAIKPQTPISEIPAVYRDILR